MNFGEILKKSWTIIWKNKILWLFGVLASCAVNRGGGGGSGNFSSGNWGDNGHGNNGFDGYFPFGSVPPWLENLGRQLERAADSGTLWIYITIFVIALLCLIFILSLIALVLGVVGKIGLVRGAWLADDSEETLTFASVWNEMKPHFWRVLLFEILVGIAGFVLGILLIIPGILLVICTCGLGLLALWALSWLVRSFLELTTVAIAGEKLGIIEALERTWNLYKANFWNVVIMAVILSIGEFVASLIIGLPILVVIAPVVIGALAKSQAALITGGITSAVLLLIYIVVATVLSGILYAYLGSAWTLTFRRIRERTPAGESVSDRLQAENPA